MSQDGKTPEDAELPGDRDPEHKDDPFALFDACGWPTRAASEINDPNAMALATVDSRRMPNVRMVLLKDAAPEGFVFYTNTESAKGRNWPPAQGGAVLSTGRACAGRCGCAGPVQPVSAEEADAYYASRALGSRIGAWASQQSRPLESRFRAGKGGGALHGAIPCTAMSRARRIGAAIALPAGDRVLAQPALPAA